MKSAVFIRLIGLVSWMGLLPQHSAAQVWQWAVAPANSTTSYSEITAMAPDKDGTTVVAGSFSGTVAFGPFTLTSAGPVDVFVGRLDGAGNWMQAVRAGSGNVCRATALVVDDDGTAVVGGSFTGLAITFGPFALANADNIGLGSSEDLFVARLNRAGTWTQAVRAGGTGNDLVTALAFDDQGNIVAGGDFGSQVASFGLLQLPNANNAPSGFGTDDLFVARLSKSGTWLQAVGAGGTSHEVLSAVAIDSEGTIVVAGYYFSPTATFGVFALPHSGIESDAFVARLNKTGAWTAATRLGGPAEDIISGLALTASGAVVVSGAFFGPAITIGSHVLTNADNTGRSCDAFVASLDRAGTWTQAVRGGGGGGDGANRVAVGDDGSVMVAGYFAGSATFGPFTLNSAGGNDIFLARLSPTGDWKHLQQAGGPGDDGILAFYAKDSSNLTIAGRSGAPTARFAPFTLANNNPLFPNAYVAHQGSPVYSSPLPALAIPNIITPNGDGRNDLFRFDHAPAVAFALRVFNRWGQPVYANAHYQQDWDATGLPAGLYYYYLERADGEAPSKGWLQVVH